MTTAAPCYGLMAEFSTPDALLWAAQQASAAGYRRIDAYTPFPVAGLSEALGFQPTRMPLIVLLGGVVGGLCGLFMQYYAAAISYPLNIGGRPLHSWPAFIPITFELTILLAALAGVLGMLALNGLPMPYHPVFHQKRFERASQDRFFLCIEATDAHFDHEDTRRFLESVAPVGEVMEVER